MFRSKAQRQQRPAEMNYALDLGKRIRGGLIACRMDSIGGSSSMPRPNYEIEERIAVVQIYGVLCNDPCWWDETGYDEIQNEMMSAAQDPEVDGILMVVNSPGGETDNAFETAAVIKAVAAKKPVWAAAAPMAYSAAYLLSSQASKIYVPQITGGVGSIGVYALHLDFSGMLEQVGITPTFISAGEGKTDGNPLQPLSPEAKVKIGAEVVRLYSEFVSQVASGRNMAESAIIKLGANLFEGSKAALGAGLADSAGSAQTAWVDLAARAAAIKSGITSGASAAGISTSGEAMNQPASTASAAGAAPPAPPATAPAAAPAPAAAQPAPAATAPAGTFTQADIDRARSEGHESGMKQATAIIELCAVANRPAKDAAVFVRERKSEADVRTALLGDRSAAAARPGETHGQVLPFEASETTAPKGALKERAEQSARKQGVLK